MNEEYQPQQLIASVESLSPAIYIKTLKAGTILLLEGTTDIYEFIVRDSEYGIVEVSSNNAALRYGIVARFMHVVGGSDPCIKLDSIQKGWAIALCFNNGQFQTQPIMSASVSGIGADGKRWHFDVF